jgi:hypothetical protein
MPHAGLLRLREHRAAAAVEAVLGGEGQIAGPVQAGRQLIEEPGLVRGGGRAGGDPHGEHDEGESRGEPRRRQMHAA